MKPMLKPVKCACGHKAAMQTYGDGFFVRCLALDVYTPICWWGPIRKTRRAAIEAWNKVM